MGDAAEAGEQTTADENNMGNEQKAMKQGFAPNFLPFCNSALGSKSDICAGNFS
jgi:hypothetical protein